MDRPERDRYPLICWDAFEAARELRAIVERIDSPHADKIFVAKDYTKADLIRDLRALIEPPVALDGAVATHVPGGITWINERFPR